MVAYIEHRPGEWVRHGVSAPIGSDIWPALQAGLERSSDCLAVVSPSMSLTGAHVLAAVESVPWCDGARRVGIHLPRSAASVVATLATWRHGGVYVPLATEQPLVRIAT